MQRKSRINNGSVYRANPSKELGTIATVPSCTNVARMGDGCVADAPGSGDHGWLWPGRFPTGRVSAVVAGGGLFGGRCMGKGWLTCDMAARVTTGRAWPDGSPCRRGSVLLVNAHDDVGTVGRRLTGCGADVRRVYVLPWQGFGYVPWLVGIRSAAELLQRAIRLLPDCRLVVIDPAAAYVAPGRAHLSVAALARLADRYGVAIVVVGDALDVRPSRPLGRAAAAVWQIRADAQDRHRRLLLPGDGHRDNQISGGLAFRIDGEPAAARWEPTGQARGAPDESKPAGRPSGQPHGRDAASGPPGAAAGLVGDRDSLAEPRAGQQAGW